MKVSSSIWKGQKKKGFGLRPVALATGHWTEAVSKKNWPQYTVYNVDVSAGVLENKVKLGTHL